MSSPAVEAFSAHAPHYTASRSRLVPGFDAFYGVAVDALGLMHSAPRRILDLGAGTGLLSARVLETFPDARLELLDASEPMLAEARTRLGASVAAVHVRDMADALPEGPFDAVVSALAIHHLPDADKRVLMARVHNVLRPGGGFVNAEQVAAPSPELTEVYTARWIADCRALGASESELDEARERMRLDRCRDVESQLAWLRDAGFSAVDCLHKSWRFAVIVAYREA